MRVVGTDLNANIVRVILMPIALDQKSEERNRNCCIAASTLHPMPDDRLAIEKVISAPNRDMRSDSIISSGVFIVFQPVITIYTEYRRIQSNDRLNKT